MIIAQYLLNFANEELIITSQRAIYWKKAQTLILSDLHIGKTAHFRKHGIAIPDEVLQTDLNRLEKMIAFFSPKKVIVVGDLFHSENNINMSAFSQWLQQYNAIEWILIRGNHDRFTTSFYNNLGFCVTNSLQVHKINFVHEPLPEEDSRCCISGHLHPGVHIKLQGKQAIRLPCYYLSKNTLLLPAFSLFTGFNTKINLPNARVYAFTNEIIWQIE